MQEKKTLEVFNRVGFPRGPSQVSQRSNTVGNRVGNGRVE